MEAVESILNQSVADFEFIIIDDGSSDGTPAILAYYEKSDGRVRSFRQENRGLIESLNRGCALARGKYIARMDADDIAIRDRLARQVAFMENNPEVGVLGGAVNIIDAAGKSLSISANPTGDGQIRSILFSECPFWHPTVVMRKEAFVAVGGYRKNMVDAEDYDLWLRIADHFGLDNLKAVVLQYRLHPFQVTVRKCRQVALSSLAARAAAVVRRKGESDPFDIIAEITPVVLAGLGVDDDTQDAAVASRYLWGIRSMYNTRQYSAALNVLDEMLRSSDWQGAETRVLADVRLLAAQLYWHEGRLAKSILTAGHAIITRPIMLGRPFKQVLRSLRPATVGVNAEEEH